MVQENYTKNRMILYNFLKILKDKNSVGRATEFYLLFIIYFDYLVVVLPSSRDVL